jgi:hypothetical protein
MPMKDGEVDILLQGRTLNFFRQWNPGDLLASVQDHVKRLLVIAQRHNQVRRLSLALEDGRLHGTPRRLWSLPRLLFLNHARWAAPTALHQRKVVLGLPSTLGPMGIVGQHCRVGERFIFRAVFFRFTALPLGQI